MIKNLSSKAAIREMSLDSPKITEERKSPSNNASAELSALISDVEPETFHTAARNQSKKAAGVKNKRSYNTVNLDKRN